MHYISTRDAVNQKLCWWLNQIDPWPSTPPIPPYTLWDLPRLTIGIVMYINDSFCHSLLGFAVNWLLMLQFISTRGVGGESSAGWERWSPLVCRAGTSGSVAPNTTAWPQLARTSASFIQAAGQFHILAPILTILYNLCDCDCMIRPPVGICGIWNQVRGSGLVLIIHNTALDI